MIKFYGINNQQEEIPRRSFNNNLQISLFIFCSSSVDSAMFVAHEIGRRVFKVKFPTQVWYIRVEYHAPAKRVPCRWLYSDIYCKLWSVKLCLQRAHCVGLAVKVKNGINVEMYRDFVDGNLDCFIHFLDLTRSGCEKCNFTI